MNGKSETTLAELIDSKFLRCSKCENVYKEPLILPCLHTFCRACVDQINTRVPVSDNKDPVNKLQCPLCKSFLWVPEEGAGAYPVNTFISNLLYIQKYKQENSRHCDYCKFDGKESEATSLCLDCKDDMCENCKDAHHRTKITRNHQVIPFKQIQNGLYDHDIRSHQRPTCGQHEEEMNSFCEVCEILICAKCKVADHDSHKSMTFEEALPRYQRHINGLLEGIQGQIPNVKKYVTYLQSYTNSIQENKLSIISQIETHADCLHKTIDEYKAEMMKKLEDQCEQEIKEACQKQNNLEIAGESLQSNSTYLEYLLTHGKNDEILTLHRLITYRLTQLMNMQIDGINKKLNLSFSAGSNIDQNIKILFGMLATDHVPVNQREATSGLDTSNGRISISSVLPPLKNSPIFVHSFDTDSESDSKDVWPTGVAITQTDGIVTVDRDNQKVKVFEKGGKMLLEFFGKPDNKLGSPFDVAILKNGNMAVTDYETNEVKIFDPNGQYKLAISGHFKHPRGITTNSKGQIIVVDCGTLELTIHDPNTGELIKRIDGKDTNGSKVMVDPHCVAVTNNDNILVTDTAAPNIKIFSPDGRYLANYGSYGTKQDQILKPFGICCDDYGYIFVADHQNHRIHVLLPDGSFSKYLLTKNDGLWHPMAVAITKNGHFLVTEALGKVRVYRYI